jgi:hypothetical protein
LLLCAFQVAGTDGTYVGVNERSPYGVRLRPPKKNVTVVVLLDVVPIDTYRRARRVSMAMPPQRLKKSENGREGEEGRTTKPNKMNIFGKNWN